MRALVTGASHGIGGATCRKLVEQALARGEPARIAAAATGTRPDLTELVHELRSLGAEAIALAADLSDPAQAQGLVQQAVEFCGGLDALVSNAGARFKAPLLQMEVSDWDRVHAVNTRATWLLGKAAHPALKASGGAIVAVTSIAGSFPFANYGPYSVSKAALIMLVQQMAAEWAPDGIRVNGVAPGITRTRANQATYDDLETAGPRTSGIPLLRPAEASEQAAAIAFLLSKEASYITGQNLLVDGGFGHNIMNTLPQTTVKGQ
ncbi:MAG TPA: SDR family oxidoreductase [Ramlibacter sp.]|nr:SDR family oxidoreductase [Ramlibacter sp.]